MVNSPLRIEIALDPPDTDRARFWEVDFLQVVLVQVRTILLIFSNFRLRVTLKEAYYFI